MQELHIAGTWRIPETTYVEAGSKYQKRTRPHHTHRCDMGRNGTRLLIADIVDIGRRPGYIANRRGLAIVVKWVGTMERVADL